MAQDNYCTLRYMNNTTVPSNTEAAIPPREVTLRNGFGEFPGFAFDAPQARRAVGILPALGTPARNYFRLGRELAARGVAAIVVELRGVGASPVRASRRVDFGYREMLRGETQALMTQLAADHPQAERHLLAHSLGAHLALLYAGHGLQPAPRAVTLVAAGTPYRRAYPTLTRMGLWLLRRLIAVSVFLTGAWHGHRLGFGGRQPARLMREWSHLARTGVLAAADGEHTLRFVPLPDAVEVRAFSMAKDSFAPRTATAHLLQATSPQAAIECIERLDDGSAPDHFNWLKRPALVVDRMLASWTVAEHAVPEAEPLPADA
jgi:predicted alpha/beta hydrolase